MLGGMMLAGLTACSGSDEEPSKTDDGVKVRRITITETEGAASARQVMTRASLAEGDGILTALWTAGDRLTCCNLSRVDLSNSGAPYSGSLTAVSTATTSQFTGDVYCLAGDYLAVVYPATTFETNDSYTTQQARHQLPLRLWQGNRDRGDRNDGQRHDREDEEPADGVQVLV